MLRPGRLALGVVSALLVAAAATALAPAAGRGLPAGSAPMTISYEGSFDLTNTMVPSGMQHSYTYHLEWAYSWTGTWGDLFQYGSAFSNETSFVKARIAGVLRVTWRNSANGPDQRCTLKIVPEMADYPSFRVSYAEGNGTVRISGLETPAYRYGRYVGSHDPMCGGGPTIDIFGEPASWKPRGEPGAVLDLGGGVHPYNRTWRWKYSFGRGLRRDYISSMHTKLKVTVAAATAD
ncbi:MAG TPA: hypothetical protein VGM80_13995 [Gaiellaceae bacterium]|jgi:hypothetical protein